MHRLEILCSLMTSLSPSLPCFSDPEPSLMTNSGAGHRWQDAGEGTRGPGDMWPALSCVTQRHSSAQSDNHLRLYYLSYIELQCVFRKNDMDRNSNIQCTNLLAIYPKRKFHIEKLTDILKKLACKVSTDSTAVTEDVPLLLSAYLHISAPTLSPWCECSDRVWVNCAVCKVRDCETRRQCWAKQRSSQGQEILSQTKPIQSQEKWVYSNF